MSNVSISYKLSRMKSALILLLTAIPLFSAQQSDFSVGEDESEGLEISNRVFGNEIVDRGQYEYVARLTVRFGSNQQEVCSGIVVSSRSVLTVAQCVMRPYGLIASSVLITLPNGGSYTFKRAEINIHPLYDSKYYLNNIALLKMDLKGNFLKGLFDYPRVISLNEFDALGVETPARVVGWGKTSRNAVSFPSKLQYGRVNIDKNCTDLSDSLDTTEIVCTLNNVAGICEGDFGGPLVTGRNKIVGLSAHRRDCSPQTDVPSVYYNLRSQTVTDWLGQDPDLGYFLMT